jgi:hypothetical protein
LSGFVTWFRRHKRNGFGGFSRGQRRSYAAPWVDRARTTGDWWNFSRLIPFGW